ncbi:unnamed protein product [Heligmosomoides polygyrus]|uniref:Octopine_DH domain-containing protein n=1 Tax=Heligmosomoides polygyrus TaxID=6339 RepID=A0A183GMV4_HELPZ|nr:unnamed protein product [Heligmosomoides polygyrus]
MVKDRAGTPPAASSASLPYGLDECFSNTSTAIQLFDRKHKIPIGKAIRLGDTIFPKLFTVALQDAIKDLNWDGKGLVDEVEKMLNEFNVTGMKIGLDMNMC